MKGFQKLYSVGILVFAFIYPSAMAEAKNTHVNHVLYHQNAGVETSFMGGNPNPEVLLAHRHNRSRIRRHHHNYRPRRHYYPNVRYSGAHYRHGRWQLVRDRHGRLIYDWHRH
jgi:hypothetical protein